MQVLQTLIDKAVKVCGSDQALADRIGIARPNVSLMRKGKRPISPATAVELADIAGEDAKQAALDAVIESVKGTRREEVIKAILGKELAAGAAAVLAISYKEGSILGTETSDNLDDITQIVKHRIHRIYQTLIRVRTLFKTGRPVFALT